MARVPIREHSMLIKVHQTLQSMSDEVVPTAESRMSTRTAARIKKVPSTFVKNPSHPGT